MKSRKRKFSIKHIFSQKKRILSIKENVCFNKSEDLN